MSSSPTTSSRSATSGLRERHHARESLSDLLPESFRLTREAARRTLGQRHFDVQLIGGMVLNDGSIAEMKTGEAKTPHRHAVDRAQRDRLARRVISRRPAEGKGVHVITVNDYLARRDCEWMLPIYDRPLGVTASYIQSDHGPGQSPSRL